MYRLLLAPLLALQAAAAFAAPVSIDVRGADGRPLVGAVVTVESARSPAAIPTGGYVMEQRDIAFQPHVLIVPVGASVSFPNRDKVRHHVYSFSKAKKIDLKLYGQEDQRSVTFDKPGIVALGCNIHDSMSGFIIVTPSPYAAQTDAAGHVAFASVPAGNAVVRVWHPTIRAADNSVAQSVVVAASGLTKTFAIGR